MKKIFLCSSFKDVASLFDTFVGADVSGKKITFIPTASLTEKVKFYVGAGRKCLEKRGFIIDELEVSTASVEEITMKLQVNDFIYVTGGNTFFLLQELKKAGADKLIKEQISAGKIYIGESAGAMILSPNIEYVTEMDSLKHTPDLQDFSGLGLVDFYIVPHYTNFPFIKSTEKILFKYQETLQLRPISNIQAICVENENAKIVTSKT